MADKKRNKEFHFDTLVQGMADKLIKPAVPAALDRLEKSNRRLWLNLAWVYLKAETNFRESFESGMRLAVVVAEWSVDMLRLPHVINDVLEFIAVRVISQIPDYFKQAENKAKLEAEKDFQPMTFEEAKESGKEFGAYIMTELRSIIDQVLSKMGAPTTEKLNAPSRFMQSLLSSPLETQNRFVAFWQWLKEGTDPDQVERNLDDMKRMISYVDSITELGGFTAADLDQQKVLFEIGRRLKRPELWPAICREARKSWAVAERLVSEFNIQLVQDTQAIADAREVELVSVEHRTRRKRLAIRRLFRMRQLRRPKVGPMGLAFAGLVVLAAVFIGISLISKLGNTPPEIRISSPQQFLAVPHDQPVKLMADISDPDMVENITYTVDGGEQERHAFFTTHHVRPTIKLGVLRSGPHRVQLYAVDRKGKSGMQEVEFVVTYPSRSAEDAPVDTTRN